MANGKYININYPFKDSPQGFFLDLNSEDQSAIKADLLHLLLTRKGQRLYNPDFGTDLIKFIFELNDTITLDELRDEVKASVKKYLPQLSITNLTVTQSEDNDYAAVVRLDYTITDTVFDIVDFVIINV
jgi:phage baseplate assembly protein W